MQILRQPLLRESEHKPQNESFIQVGHFLNFCSFSLTEFPKTTLTDALTWKSLGVLTCLLLNIYILKSFQ